MVLVAVSTMPAGVQAQTGTSLAASASCYTFTRDLGIGLPSNDREEAALNTVLNNANIDGSTFSSYDEDVAARVVMLQQKYGIRATGYFGPITRAKINSLFGCNGGTSNNNCPVFSVNLNIGSTGSEVERLQTWLIANGYDIPAITEDHAAKGYFGPSTSKALKKYQDKADIGGDEEKLGTLGPKTRSILAERCMPGNHKKEDNNKKEDKDKKNDDNEHNDNNKNSSVGVSASLMDANTDKVGSGFGQSVGIGNNNPADWHFITMVTSDKVRNIREIYIKSNRYGEAWSTTNNTSLVGSGPYPLYVSGKAYENTAYDQIIPIDSSGTTRFDLYAQPESTPFAGGTIVVNFIDGTSAQSTIPVSAVQQASGVACSTSDFRCSGGVVTQTPSCSLYANKSSYRVGETITYSWNSRSATYASWQQDVSGRDHLWLPSDKLGSSGSQNVTASVTGNPSVTLQVSGFGGSSSCSAAVLVLPQAQSATVSASLVDASSDKVGSSFGIGAGIRNTNPNDWHWVATISNPGGQVSIQSISVVSNIYGEGWSTSDDTSLFGKGPYPLAMYLNGQSVNSHYNVFLASGGESQTLDLYGQPETVPFSGGTIIVKFSDGTKVQAQIAASSIVQTSPVTNTSSTTIQNSDRSYSAP